MCTADYQKSKAIYDKCTDNPRPEQYFKTFIIGIVFLLSWSPWCILQIHGILTDSSEVLQDRYPALNFYFMWLAIGNSLWKFVIYVIFNHDFRIGIKILYSRCPKCHREDPIAEL